MQIWFCAILNILIYLHIIMQCTNFVESAFRKILKIEKKNSQIWWFHQYQLASIFTELVKLTLSNICKIMDNSLIGTLWYQMLYFHEHRLNNYQCSTNIDETEHCWYPLWHDFYCWVRAHLFAWDTEWSPFLYKSSFHTHTYHNGVSRIKHILRQDSDFAGKHCYMSELILSLFLKFISECHEFIKQMVNNVSSEDFHS